MENNDWAVYESNVYYISRSVFWLVASRAAPTNRNCFRQSRFGQGHDGFGKRILDWWKSIHNQNFMFPIGQLPDVPTDPNYSCCFPHSEKEFGPTKSLANKNNIMRC